MTSKHDNPAEAVLLSFPYARKSVSQRLATAAPGILIVFPGCDPKRLIRDALHTDWGSETQPEDILLAWLIDLPDGIDPAAAAVALLAYIDQHSRQNWNDNFAARLDTLLVEVSLYPRDRLDRIVQGNRQRRLRTRVVHKPC